MNDVCANTSEITFSGFRPKMRLLLPTGYEALWDRRA